MVKLSKLLKRIRLILILLTILVSITACTKIPDDSPVDAISTEHTSGILEDEDETVARINKEDRLCEELGYPDQSNPPEYEWTNLSDTSDVETVYDNIEISLSRTTYSFMSLIKIRVTNHNQKPFALFPVPYLEVWSEESNGWERLTYAPDRWYYLTGCATCFSSTIIRFDPNYVIEDLKAGKYRFLVFCGKKTFYSPEFNLE